MSEINVSVRLVVEDKKDTHSFPPGAQIVDLLEKFNRNPEAVVVKRNEKIVPEGEELEDGDEIEIIPVVSGG